MKKAEQRLLDLVRHKKPVLIVAVVIIFLDFAIVGYALFQPSRPRDEKRIVTIYDRGTRRTILTRADTVKEVLRAADIPIDARDVVDPSRETKLTESNDDIIIYRSRLVAVVDGGTRQTVLTVAQSPNAILKDANMKLLNRKDKTTIKPANLVNDGASAILSVDRAKVKKKKQPVTFKPRPDALTASKGAQVFVDSDGVAHRETYYDLPMNVVIGACGKGGKYTVRSDGAKIDQDGYVLIAANLQSYPRCSVVETSLGPGKVYDTGGFAVRHPYGFDLATDWTNHDGR